MDSTMFIILLLVVFPCVVLAISALLNRKSQMTAYATVVSHRLDLGIGGGMYGGDNWNRLITFRLKDGSEMELYTVREDYETLIDGQSGQITWEKENLLHFDPDIPQ